MSSDDVRSGWRRGALADPDRPGGCLRRVGDELGVNPETLRGWVRQARIDAGDRPGTTTEGARRTGELEKEVREPGRGARSGGARRIALWRRSVSARRADPPSASTSAREELRGPCRICTVLTESGCRIAPSTYYAARSRPPSARSISDAALDERILALRAEPFNATLGSRKTWRLLNTRQEGPGVARCTVERRMRALGLTGAGPGRTVRTTGPAKGNPVPARPARAATPAAARCGPALGGRLHPRADPVGVLLHRLRHGACSPAASSAGPPAAARGTDNAAGAPGQAIWQRKDREGGDPRGPGTTTVASACPSPTPDDSSTRASRHRPEPWDPPTRAPPPRPRASPCKRGARSGATAPGGTATTPGTATARWVNWYNRTRPHRANPDDLSPAAAEHRYHRNHTTATAAAPATA